MAADISNVRKFWEENPLWTGESQHEVGSEPFFVEHRETVLQDCMANRWDDRLSPPAEARTILDLGCGIGFWTVELAKITGQRIVSVDLTKAGCQLTRLRGQVFGTETRPSTGDAEHLPFPEGTFDHVNCQGVIHHTPDTEAAVAEIHRVLRPGGTASVSVYYSNLLVRAWPVISPIRKLLASVGIGLKGRGREGMLHAQSVEELVRQYDGADNPVGKTYTLKEARNLFDPHFEVEQTFLHFFPKRAFPVAMPESVHRFCDRQLGFLIYFSLRKR